MTALKSQNATSIVAIPAERIERRILLIRGQRVLLSPHLAELYGVEPRVLIQAVKRNFSRFPADFMFQLTRKEFANLRSQFVTSSWGGLRRATPYAFTEQGVAMLSSVLRSEPRGNYGGMARVGVHWFRDGFPPPLRGGDSLLQERRRVESAAERRVVIDGRPC